ncbi:hypothetical protein PRZ48_006141 [Zasmidium cellare]|uniref:Sulfatase N-terminal domain-containing protein n=1 Tax=Zasmidium cellare TaxID=395010 RepID=A0ABR0EML5_ZASCE|nr:hypothetical protein PRZ48_006141 [Zasmidium cellare]
MSKTRPNFLVILADDLGFSDIGCYGSEIKTPNIDSLATEQNSLRFTSFHVAAACSPTRSMLLSGVEHHLTGLGQLAELVRMSPAHQGAPGHEGYLNDKIVTLPQLLSDAGYFTCMSGKWHLGLRRKHFPDKKGFQKSFAMLQGACNHYAWEPTYEDPKISYGFMDVNTAPHVENGEHVKVPDDFYSSDYYASKLIEILGDRSDEEKQKPFFAYLPFTAPHWPLQAPEESVKPYHGRYKDGPAALRLERLDSLRKLGLIPADVVAHEVVAIPGEQPEWDQLSSEEQAKSARAMETYAGMVSRMDENIGRVIDHLKKAGEYDNTYILFMSDNGAEGASFEARPIVGQNMMDHIHKYYDNRLENIGRSNSFVWYGTRWAQAATSPSRLHKMFSTEGGCRVPLVLKGPKNGHQHHDASITDAFCTVLDLVPTFLEEAGAHHPGTQYDGRTIHGLDPTARSLIPFLAKSDVRPLGTSAGTSFYAVHPEDEAHGWEMAGSGGLRRGRYKITFVPKPKGPQKWQLYDIIADPGEVKDLRGEKPQLFEELHELWLQYKNRVGVVGVAGEFDPKKRPEPGLTDEFEDDTQWMRFIGKKDIELPERFNQ